MKNDFLIVFSPKSPENYNKRKRFLISINQLKRYIGNNDLNVIKQTHSLKQDKHTLKLRKYGKIEIYLK